MQKVRIILIMAGLQFLSMICNIDCIAQTFLQHPGSVPTFKHPCIPYSAEGLATAKAHVKSGDQPWTTAYSSLKSSSFANYNYNMAGPFVTVGRNADVNLQPWRNDMKAAWYNAMMWYFDGNELYAKKSCQILMAYARTQKEFTGMESNLDLGDYAYAWAGAASILRGTWNGWTKAHTDTLKKFWNDVYWPASGCSLNILGESNKGTLSLTAGIAIAAFSDSVELVNHILYLMLSNGAAGFPNTLPNGQIGENGRDQGHACGDWGNMVYTAEILWNLGIDVFSYLDNRLLAVAEYWSRDNVDGTIPYIPYGTVDYHYLSVADPYGLWTGMSYMQKVAYNHYVVRKGLGAPYLTKICKAEYQNERSTFSVRSSDTSKAVPVTPMVFPAADLVGEGLTNIDIGGAAPTGSGTYGNNIWTVTGGGTNIATHGSMSYHFVGKKITGDCAIIARVDSIGAMSNDTKFGVIIAEAASPGEISGSSKRVWCALTPNKQAYGYLHGYNQVWGGSNYEARIRDLPRTAPWWVKVERLGNKLAAYISPDGVSWAVTSEGWFGADMKADTYVGLVVSSGSNGKLSTAKFSNVSITGGTGGIVTVPEAPLMVLSSPNDGSNNIRWPASFGAVSYTLKRATDSTSVYTTIASDIINNSYTDTNVSNGRTYYYKVCAVNTAGVSEDSPADSTMPKVSPSLKILPSGTYKIIAKHSNKVIEVSGGTTSEGAVIDQTTYNDGANQKWIITQVNGTEYKVINLKSGMALDIKGNSSANGASIEQRTYSETDSSQKWIIADNDNGTYRILNRQNFKSIDITSASTSDGALGILWTYSGATNQSFILEPLLVPVITSSSRISCAKDKLFTYGITATNSPTSYSAVNLPAGLSINTSTGVISGTPTALGIYLVTLSVQNNAGTTTLALTVSINKKLEQTITLSGSISKVVTDIDFAPGATASSGLPVTLNSADTTLATIVNGKVHLKGGGICTIYANQAGDINYYAAPQASLTLSIAKLSQAITFNSIPGKIGTDTDFNPGATASSGLPIAYSSSDTTVATIVNGKVHITGGGTCFIYADQPGSLQYDAALQQKRPLTISKADQTLTFNALPEKTIGDADFDPQAVVTSGLTITYSTSNSAVGSIRAGKIHIVAVGTCTIYAIQSGNAIYNATSKIGQILVVNPLKADQTITFDPLPEKKTGDADFSPGAIASSGLPVSYTSSNISVVTIADSKIHIVAVGTSIITASQPGDALNYKKAPDVSQLLTVSPATGINDFKEDGFKIYPNPTNGDLMIKADKNKVIGISIFDLSGHEMMVIKNNMEFNRISLKDLPCGTYLVKIMLDKRVISKIIVKE